MYVLTSLHHIIFYDIIIPIFNCEMTHFVQDVSRYIYISRYNENYFRPGGRVWASWAWTPPLFGGNRVKPGPGPTTFFWRIRAGPHQFQNRDYSPELYGVIFLKNKIKEICTFYRNILRRLLHQWIRFVSSRDDYETMENLRRHFQAQVALELPDYSPMASVI